MSPGRLFVIRPTPHSTLESIRDVTKLSANRDDQDASAPARSSRLSRSAVAVFVLVLVVVGPVVHHLGEQQSSRYALTAALWDSQTVVIDDYAHLLGRDRVVVDGVTYSDKAPGQPFLAVPFYGLYRLAGGVSPAQEYDLEADFGQWWVTLWSAAVPGAILAFLMFRWAREVEERTALSATLTIALGTLLIVYSTILFGHVLAALFLFGMFLIVRRPNPSSWALAAGGALGGAAVLTEYPAGLVVALLTVATVWRHRAKVLALIAGGVPFALGLGAYHIRLFGDPFTFTYQWSAFFGPQEQATAMTEIFAGPTGERFLHVLFSPRGLLIATPVLLVAAIGLVPMWRQGWRFDVLVVAAAVLAMLSIPFSWGNSYAGGAGPRYFTPAIPFLVAPLAVAWGKWRIAAGVTAVISLFTMILATLTEPQVATHLEGGIRYWLVVAGRGDWEPTVYNFAFGGFGWVVYAATIAGAVWLVARSMRKPTGSSL